MDLGLKRRDKKVVKLTIKVKWVGNGIEMERVMLVAVFWEETGFFYDDYNLRGKRDEFDMNISELIHLT